MPFFILLPTSTHLNPHFFNILFMLILTYMLKNTQQALAVALLLSFFVVSGFRRPANPDVPSIVPQTAHFNNPGPKPKFFFMQCLKFLCVISMSFWLLPSLDRP